MTKLSAGGHARPDDVRPALHDGPSRFALRQGLRPDHRHLLRRRQHADHDPDGPQHVLDKIGNSENFVKGIHSVGDFDPGQRYIMHFPQEGLVWSIGSGYGGNALLGKKCFSLRIASYLGLRQSWLAEHMVIMGIEDTKGRTRPTSRPPCPRPAARPTWPCSSRPCPNTRSTTIGDDIAWLNVGPDGRLYAINPEAGFFGVAPGTSMKTNPNMIRTLKASELLPDALHQRRPRPRHQRALVGGTGRPAAEHASTGRASPGRQDGGTKAAHPNSPLHRLPLQLPDPVQGVRQSPGRADLGHPHRRPPLPPHAPRQSRPSTGPTACSWAPGRAPRRRPPRPARSASCAATPSPCSPSAATTWAITSATGSTWAGT